MKKIAIFLYFISTSAFLSAQLYFPPIDSDEWETLSSSDLGWCESSINNLYTFLDDNDTKAFIVLQDGKIVLEQYFDNHTQSTPWYWASAGKSLTAFLIGLAQQDGMLTINNPTSDYLGQGWTSCTPEQEAQITVRHQLTMTTGLDDEIDNVNCTEPSCLIYRTDSGARWAYHNAPYTLLTSVLENATGTALNTYVYQQLRNTTGITGAYISQEDNQVFFSNARNMARYGLLILNNGNWDGMSILQDSDYFNSMVNTSQNLNESYGYLWWLNGKSSYMLPQTQFVFNDEITPNAPSDMIAALGKNGQIINVIPSENMVWIRMGNAPENSLIANILNNQIWEYINELDCEPLAIEETEEVPDEKDVSPLLHFYPNPTHTTLQVELSPEINLTNCHLTIINQQGIAVKTFYPHQSLFPIDLSTLPIGLYFIKINTQNRVIVQPFLKSSKL